MEYSIKNEYDVLKPQNLFIYFRLMWSFLRLNCEKPQGSIRQHKNEKKFIIFSSRLNDWKRKKDQAYKKK